MDELDKRIDGSYFHPSLSFYRFCGKEREVAVICEKENDRRTSNG